MSWSIGFDERWSRDIGYGVPAVCDHSHCSEDIDRGLSCVCGGDPYGGEHGCGLYFCGKHLILTDVDGESVFLCERCCEEELSFEPKPDTSEWIKHKLTDKSWKPWRDQNPAEVEKLRAKSN